MHSFKLFIKEKYIPPNEGSLYHFIDDIGVHSALHHDMLSPITYNHPNWSPSTPSPIMKSTGHVSLTRDPSLNFSGRQIRLRLNRQSLEHSGHKPEQYYDPLMHVPGEWERDTPAGDPNVPLTNPSYAVSRSTYLLS